MSSSSSSSSGGGTGFTGLLTVLFVGLKLTGYINWPWLWVLSPLWISASIALAYLLVLAVIYLVEARLKGRR